MYKTFTHSLFGAVIMPTILASTISINPVNIDPKMPIGTNSIEQILDSNLGSDTIASDLAQKE
ncbi:MAG: hypothetical protein QG556_869, partial [Pseudomonadota bacterium]|nr:hypothetical protein [Pseudomonadota bacterium]